MLLVWRLLQRLRRLVLRGRLLLRRRVMLLLQRRLLVLLVLLQGHARALVACSSDPGEGVSRQGHSQGSRDKDTRSRAVSAAHKPALQLLGSPRPTWPKATRPQRPASRLGWAEGRAAAPDARGGVQQVVGPRTQPVEALRGTAASQPTGSNT
jgi:hypothetical protein